MPTSHPRPGYTTLLSTGALVSRHSGETCVFGGAAFGALGGLDVREGWIYERVGLCVKDVVGLSGDEIAVFYYKPYRVAHFLNPRLSNIYELIYTHQRNREICLPR